jgi:hypothetical protein
MVQNHEIVYARIKVYLEVYDTPMHTAHHVNKSSYEYIQFAVTKLFPHISNPVHVTPTRINRR